MTENSSNTTQAGKKSTGDSLLFSSDFPWKVGFILLLVIAGWVYIRRALEVYAAEPIPSADALEYFELAKYFYQGHFPTDNPWMDRWPGLPLVIAMFWHLSGITSLVQYMIGAVAMPAAAAIVGILAWKRSGPLLAISSMALLLFMPATLETADSGIADSLFALLIMQSVAVGYLLPGRPLVYALPAACIVSLLVLCREGGHYFALWALILFSALYLRQRQFSFKLLGALFLCTISAVLALYAFWHHLEQYNLIPISFRYGQGCFYHEYLQNRVSFKDNNRIYALMSFFDWLKLHPLEQWPGMFFTGLSNLCKVFDKMLFPGAWLLVAVSLIRSALGKWTLEVLFCLPLVGFYIPYYYVRTETRFLICFCCIGLPAVMEGLVLIANSLSFKAQPKFSKRLSTILPLVFCLVTLGSAHFLNYAPKLTTLHSPRYPDQSEAELRITTLLYNGRFAEAADSVTMGLSRNPELAFFYLARGFLLYMQDDKKSAFDELETSLSLNPYQTEAYYVAYHLHWREGQREQALSYLERSLEYRPEFPLIRKILEHFYRSSGRTEKLELLDRKGPFNYYLQHPKLRRLALVSVMWWNQLLQNHAPLSGAGLTSYKETTTDDTPSSR